jgi:hypothetical protein
MSNGIPKNQVKSVNTINQSEHEDDADARRVLPIDQFGEYFGTPTNPIFVEGEIEVNPDAGVDTPTIFNISALLSGTEYSQVIPDGTRKFILKVRGGEAALKIAFSAGGTSTTFLSVSRGANFIISGVSLTSATVYFQVDKPGKIIEILTWS